MAKGLEYKERMGDAVGQSVLVAQGKRIEELQAQLARLVEELEQQGRFCQDIVNDFNLLKPPQIKRDIQSIANHLFRLCKAATSTEHLEAPIQEGE